MLLYVPVRRKQSAGELRFIQELSLSAGRGRGAVRLGIGDDCAILRPPAGDEILVTTDFSLEGRHFRRNWHPGRSAGHRCLARGLSDIAAMGGKPISAFLSLAIPPTLRQTRSGRLWLADFLAGLLDLARETGTQLSGGDTAAANGDAVLADIVLLGSAPLDRAIRRSGAKAGDVLYVSGRLGGAAAELKMLAAKPRGFRDAAADGTHPHLYPEPRLTLGQVLLRRGLATAAIDLSDGLSTDLHHLCEASGVGAIVDAEALPLHPLAQRNAKEALASALHGGEDYELLFTAQSASKIPKTLGGVPVMRIGTITKARSVLLRQNGQLAELLRGGWEHRL